METDLTFEEVLKAYFDCRKHKRNTVNSLQFEENFEQNLMELYNDLVNGTYEIGKSICFVVEYPKIREVWAADFRDRIVHHLIYNRYSDIFYRSFIHDSYACIPEKGTLKTAKRVQHFMRSCQQKNPNKPIYFLKIDIANFFMSIDKDILCGLIEKKITDGWWLKLTRQIIYHNPKTNVEVRGKQTLISRVPSHKSLFLATQGKGLPIGNLSSQFFANVYLNVLDQYVKHKVKAVCYVRYVDDVVIIHPEPNWLNQTFNRLQEFVNRELKITFHPNKKEINLIEKGVNFVGYIIKPYTRYLRRFIWQNFLQRVKETDNLLATVNSYLGMMTHTNSYKQRQWVKELLPDYQFDTNITKMIKQPV